MMTDNTELTRKLLLPKIKTTSYEDDLPPSEINRIGKEAGFDLSGPKAGKAPVKKSRPPRETRTDVINVRLKPSIAEALRQYTYDEDVSQADVIEKLIQRYIIDRSLT